MTWTIHAMRDLNAADPVGGLGPRVTPAPTPAPAPVKRGDGFVVGHDGKLSTDLPDPTQEPAPILCKCGLTPAACAMTSCSPPWPFPQRACLAPEPVALRVGDRVRCISDFWSPDVRAKVFAVTEVGAQWFRADEPKREDGSLQINVIVDIGRADLWERA